MANNNSQDYYNRKLATKYTSFTVKESAMLLDFIMKSMDGISRTRAKEFLAHKMVYVDHQIVTQYNHQLSAGQLVQISKKSNIHEFNHKLIRIVYEDAFLIVVEKSILSKYVNRQKKGMTVHTVHRLDRETSGLLIFAKRRDVQQTLVDNWQNIVTDRKYIAVVEGDIEKDNGVVSSWLADNRMFVTYSSPIDNGGKYSVTRYSVKKRANGLTLVELKLETGRKNQIRVHMQDLKHSIIGDYKYGSTIDPLGRIALHAYKIRFYHPITNELLNIELPIPQSFKQLFHKSN